MARVTGREGETARERGLVGPTGGQHVPLCGRRERRGKEGRGGETDRPEYANRYSRDSTTVVLPQP